MVNLKDMEKIKLLLVEDSESYAQMIKNSLEYLGIYIICTANNGKDGLDVYKTFNPDIIVVDLEMPIMDGKEMLRIIREKDVYTPVIFLSAHLDAANCIDGLKMGANDYLRKPIIVPELDARIQTILKRFSIKGLPVMGNEECVIGSFGFSALGKYITRNGKLTELTKTEVRVLDILVSNKGQLVRRDDIYISLGKKNNEFSARVLDVQIVSIRKKLKGDDSVEIITIRGEGFILKDGYV